MVESDDDDLERYFVKFPGEELTDVSRVRNQGETSPDNIKLAKLMRETKKDFYGTLHDHRYDIPIPTETDLRNLLGNDRQKYMVISERNGDNKVIGYFFLKKKPRK